LNTGGVRFTFNLRLIDRWFGFPPYSKTITNLLSAMVALITEATQQTATEREEATFLNRFSLVKGSSSGAALLVFLRISWPFLL
jgi:hypothetical protein